MGTQTAQNIRPIVPADMMAIKEVIDAGELFPSELLDDMIADYFAREECTDIWLTYEEETRPVAVAYCAPERMTEGTWNLYLIVFHPGFQGGGRGKRLLSYIEELLVKKGERVLIVETSGLESFESTRLFYRKCGYDEEARIREFYQKGEDKIVFWKSLEK